MVKVELQARTVGEYAFDVKAGPFSMILDSGSRPGYDSQGMTPKQALMAAIIGCSAMDIVGWMNKKKVPYESFKVSGGSEQTTTHPKVFVEAEIVFDIEGSQINESHLPIIVEAADLSMTKYCGVSAMVSKVVPLFYTVRINGEIEYRGQAKFF